MLHAIELSPGAWKQTSESEPQSESCVHERQCAGLSGMQYPSGEPAVMGSQKNVVPAPQSACEAHGVTHTGGVWMTTGLQSPDWQSVPVVHVAPRAPPEDDPPPVPDEEEDDDAAVVVELLLLLLLLVELPPPAPVITPLDDDALLLLVLPPAPLVRLPLELPVAQPASKAREAATAAPRS
jgi:hypothetical protein